MQQGWWWLVGNLVVWRRGCRLVGNLVVWWRWWRLVENLVVWRRWQWWIGVELMLHLFEWRLLPLHLLAKDVDGVLQLCKPS
jgi:hypothetical protein